MEISVAEITAGLQLWHLANVNDALKKHCARLINHSWPSLMIHDSREERKKGKKR